jgi:hypothetical protein
LPSLDRHDLVQLIQRDPLFEGWQPWLGHSCDAFFLVQVVDSLHNDIQLCRHFLDFFCHIETREVLVEDFVLAQFINQVDGMVFDS